MSWYGLAQSLNNSPTHPVIYLLIIAKLSDRNRLDPGNHVLLVGAPAEDPIREEVLLLLKHYILLQINILKMFLIPMEDFPILKIKISGLLSHLLTLLNPQLQMTLCPLLTHVLAV